MPPIPTGDDINWYVYKLVSPSNRVYVGLTKDIVARQKDYERADCKNQIALHYSLKKYGFSSHEFSVVETFSSDYKYALGKEMFWIRSYMANRSKFPEQNGLNMTDGGRGSIGRKMSDDTKQKLRLANIGRKVSDETKKKISKASKGRKTNRVWTLEDRVAQSNRVKGFKHTKEAKRKISEAGIGNKHNLGRKQSAEVIANRVKYLIGNKFNVGRKHSPELIEKRISKIRGVKRIKNKI